MQLFLNKLFLSLFMGALTFVKPTTASEHMRFCDFNETTLSPHAQYPFPTALYNNYNSFKRPLSLSQIENIEFEFIRRGLAIDSQAYKDCLALIQREDPMIGSYCCITITETIETKEVISSIPTVHKILLDYNLAQPYIKELLRKIFHKHQKINKKRNMIQYKF